MSAASRGSLAAAVCIALVVAAVLWFLRAEDPRAVGGLDAASREAAAAEVPGAARDGVPLATDESAQNAPARVGSTVAETSSSPTTGPTLVLARVTAVETGEPVEHVYVTAWRENGTILATPQEIETDEHGEAEIEVESGVALIVSAQGDGRNTGSANAPIPALAAGERRAVSLAIVTREDVVVHGVVLRRDTREPLANVAVDAVSVRRSGPGPRATTGNDGRFRIAVRSFATASLRYEHAEFGTALSPARAGHEDTARALEILLEPAASIRALVTSADGADVTGWTAVATATPWALEQPPGSWVQGPADVRFTAAVEAGGVALVARVPAHVPLALEIRRGSRAVWQAREPLVLAPGETREVACLTGAASIFGFVREADGAAAADVVLQAEPESATSASADPRARGATVSATTDAEGAYRFEGLDPGAWLVGPAIAAADDRDPRRDPAPIARRVVIEPSGAGVRHDVVLVRGLVVAGRVLRADGSAAAGAIVAGRCDAELADVHVTAGSDGAFVLGPLCPGTWRLRASANGASPSTPAEFGAGTEDVELRLGAKAQIDVVVRDESGVPLSGVAVSAIESSGHGEAHSQLTEADGTTVFDAFPPGSYDVVAATHDGRFAAQRGVALAANAGVAITLIAEPAGRARLRLDGPEDAGLVIVTERGALVAFLPLTRGVAVDLVGPLGKVSLQIRSGGRRHDHELVLGREPGADVVFDGAWR